MLRGSQINLNSFSYCVVQIWKAGSTSSTRSRRATLSCSPPRTSRRLTTGSWLSTGPLVRLTSRRLRSRLERTPWSPKYKEVPVHCLLWITVRGCSTKPGATHYNLNGACYFEDYTSTVRVKFEDSYKSLGKVKESYAC